MNILAIDPGHKTGIAVINEYGDCLHIDTRDTHRLDEVEKLTDHLSVLVAEYKPEYIVIETPPNFRLVDKETMGLYQLLINTTFTRWRNQLVVMEASPGWWKPVTGKLKLPFETKSQHEKDAYRMARYALNGIGQNGRNVRG